MKTLCVAAVVLLSLTSVCQAESLACEKLLKPVDKGPDIRGSWYLISISTRVSWISTLINSTLKPSIEVNVTSKDTPNIYSTEYKFKIFGSCDTYTEDYLYENNTLSDVNIQGNPVGQPDVLLQSDCPDCIVVKAKNNMLFLLSRRKTVTDAELKEFESQAQCLGWSKPEVMSSDYDYKNCLPFHEDDVDTSRLSFSSFNRLKKTKSAVFKCLMETAYSDPKAAFELAQEMWSEFW